MSHILVLSDTHRLTSHCPLKSDSQNNQAWRSRAPLSTISPRFKQRSLRQSWQPAERRGNAAKQAKQRRNISHYRETHSTDRRKDLNSPFMAERTKYIFIIQSEGGGDGELCVWSAAALIHSVILRLLCTAWASKWLWHHHPNHASIDLNTPPPCIPANQNTATCLIRNLYFYF